MWHLLNTFWGWVWGWANITGWGLFLCGLSLTDKYANGIYLVMAGGGLVLGVIGAFAEHHVRKANSEGRAFNRKLRR